MQVGDVQLWLVRTAAFGPAEREALQRLLDREELTKASRLRLEIDRHAYVVAHGACRLALGDLLGVSPQSLRFSRDTHGKPALRDGGGGLHFSLSHTRGLVACAASASGPLGIDVEALDDTQDDAGLIDRFICPPDPGLLPAQPDAAFHACWTALEAYWKARGTGLTPANPRLKLSRADGDALHASLEHDSSGASRLVITPVDAGPGFAVALACGWTPTLQRMALPSTHHERAQRCDNRPLRFRGQFSRAAFV